MLSKFLLSCHMFYCTTNRFCVVAGAMKSKVVSTFTLCLCSDRNINNTVIYFFTSLSLLLASLHGPSISELYFKINYKHVKLCDCIFNNCDVITLTKSQSRQATY